MRETTIPEEDGEADNTKQQKKQVTQSMDDDLIMILSRRKPQKQKQKYVFMSEKDMVTKGEFSEKYKDEKENKDIPKPYQGLMPKSYSALGGMLSASPDKSMSMYFCISLVCACKLKIACKTVKLLSFWKNCNIQLHYHITKS